METQINDTFNFRIKIKPREFLKEENPKCEKLDQMRERLKDLLLYTSAHGVARLIRTKHTFIKILWVISMLLSASYCFYFINKLLISYLDYEVVTDSDVKYEVKSEFPAVSICNPDMPLEDETIQKCNFNSNNSTSYLDSFNDPYFGRCLRFNSKGNVRSKNILSSTSSGSKYGLQLDLIINSTNQFNELILYIHNHSFLTSTLVNKGFRISSGSIYFFSVERSFNVKLDAPYSTCLKDSTDSKLNKTLINHLIANLSSIYTYKDCFRLCRNLVVMEQSKCNCMITFDNAAACSKHPNQTVRDCYNKFVAEFQLSSRNSYNKCNDFCPIECDSYNLLITPLVEPLPVTGPVKNTSSFQYASKFRNFEEVKRSFFSIYVYYEELKYTVIKENPKTETFNLASGIGGTLGLFLGISFLSFVEIIETLYVFISIILGNNVKPMS